ncbi:DNA polymerase III subunit alpha [Rhizosphaericola mali]|uniref:DNA polymerase III subunit alpha n=1 Tax=Rhizosphaericola mali TaxID=2545455 RepID=A0A5P2G971_9BACT|nr:DNA polymerase III subunit alpha [Rhizosphaericola mali]QES89763.1 DNA polymerase III subunit alpha [Rhizosphaericola mali]
MPQFSHLHSHTQFSLLDGQASIDSLLAKATREGMPGLAITDHGNMYGIFDFVAKAWKDTKIIGKDAFGKDIVVPKVKPIVGCELYVVDDRFQKTFTKDKRDKRFHQILLAKNKKGYENLVKLTSLGFIDGLYGKYPRVDKKLIEEYHSDLIATTCCIGASVPQAILNKSAEEAEAEFKWWLDLFGEDYYIELQRHNLKEQEIVNERLLEYAAKYNVPVICTNDSHYTDQEDANAHDILLCINTGEKQATPGYDDFVNDDTLLKNRRFKFPNDQFYFKTTKEMESLFKDIPQSLENTQQIVDKVEPLKLMQDIMLPNFPIPAEYSRTNDDTLNQWNYLHALTYEGAKRRYSEITEEIRERIDFELNTVRTMGFAGYFLIVWDFIKAGKDMGVYIGPGRGSAAGSVVAYCLEITNIDPIKYDLLFERFLNPDRKSMPDIDTDFEDEGRQRVIDYVVKKYTKQQVAQIVTYGTMAAKMSIKDVARALDLPLPDSNALAKLVPDKPGTKLKRVLKAPITSKDAKNGEKSLEDKEGFGPEDIENIKKIREIYAGDDLRAEVLHEAERLEGCVRNTGMHACGIIIAPKDLTEIVPVSMSKDSDLLITEYESSVIESAGVIKMDFLGLKNLSILKDAIKLIKQNYDIELSVNDVALDDDITYQLYQRGDTNATFQFESAGMQKYLRELKPDKFADLIAMNALYRPGPIAYIPDFIKRKHGIEAIEYDLPEMEEYLSDTYGITVYQEQVMLLSQKLAGFSKGDADVLRKAMGKKQIEVLNKMEAKFVEGAKKNGHPEDKLKKIWEDWKAFAQYAFNKSHSTCYAYVAFQTGYLKAHYPSEYMAAILNHAGDLSKITFYMEECKKMGIKVLGCDINESDKGFSVNHHGHIRFGMGGLKGVGEAAIESIIEERTKNGNYKDVFDFIKRVNQRTVNKRSIESLVYSGAFDCFPEMSRAQFFNIQAGETVYNIERIIKFGNACSAGEQNMMASLFGDMGMPEIPTPKILPCDEWSLIEKLEKEKEVTGIYLSGHPLDRFKFEMQHYGIMPIADFVEMKDSQEKKPPTGRNFKVAGLVTEAQHRITKTGRDFGILHVEDFSGKTDFALWSDDYVKFKNYLEAGLIVLINGFFKQRYNSDVYEFKINSLCLLETARSTMAKSLEIVMRPQNVTPEFVDFLSTNMEKNIGNVPLKFKIFNPDDQVMINLLSANNGLEINDELCDFLMNTPDIELNVAING